MKYFQLLFHPIYTCIICVLNTQHLCAKNMNSWKNDFCTIYVIKSWDGQFVMWLSTSSNHMAYIEMNFFLSNALIDTNNFDLIIKLDFWKKNIKKEVIRVIDFFLSFLTWYDERGVHNMIALMLDPRFKSLKLNFSFMKVAITKEHDRKSLFPMLLRSYYHLHPLLTKLMKFHTFWRWYLTPVNVQKSLLIFHRYEMDAKGIKCFLEWGRKHETMFPTIGFLTKHYWKL
jgi:hypothetical protein